MLTERQTVWGFRVAGVVFMVVAIGFMLYIGLEPNLLEIMIGWSLAGMGFILCIFSIMVRWMINEGRKEENA